MSGLAMWVKQQLDVHKDKYVPHRSPFSVERKEQDADGIFREIEWRRDDASNTLYRKSVLSGGTAPEYAVRTVTIYEDDGTTPRETIVYDLTYNADGEFLKEEMQE